MKTKMKNYVLALITIISISSCSQIEDALDKITFIDHVFYKEITVPAANVVPDKVFDITSADITTDIDQIASENNFNVDLLDLVELNKVKCTITTPTSGDFTFLNSIEIFMVADGVQETKIASSSTISPTIGNTIDLNIESNDNLIEYLNNGSIKLRVVMSANKTISEDYIIKLEPKFRFNFSIN